MRRRLALVTILLAGTITGVGAAQKSPPSASGLDLELGVKIPMRDGVRLNATMYFPRHREGPMPVILAMTPYIADRYHPYVLPIAHRGYIVAVADVRGRGSSEGVFDPFAQEAKDGYDAVEWLAKQPWSNGKIGMIGGSYGGFNQWSIVKELPPHLASITPTASSHMGIDFPANGAIGVPYEIQWISFTSGHEGAGNLFADQGYWDDKFRELYRQHLPFKVLDSLVGNPSPVFQKWLQHPGYDSYWSSMAPSPEQLGKIAIPILTRTGMYDGDQVGAMEHYRNHMRYGTPDAIAKHYLVIGPWDHEGTRTPKREVAGIPFGPASMIDMGELEADWFDWTLKGGPKPRLLQKRVAYYVTGADVWKYADSLSELGRHPAKYYLSSPGRGAETAAHAGILATAQPSTTPADQWTYDPLDTRPGERPIDKELDFSPEADGAGLVYQTAPFDRVTEISGFPKLTLWLKLDVPDTDIWVTLYEVTAAGKALNLDDAPLRLRYRESRVQPTLITPGQATKVEFDRFRFMSRAVARGSRIRLVIQSPNSIRVQKNYNSGGDVALETAQDAKTAHIQLLHEGNTWSVLELPVAQ